MLRQNLVLVVQNDYNYTRDWQTYTQTKEMITFRRPRRQYLPAFMNRQMECAIDRPRAGDSQCKISFQQLEIVGI